MKISQKGLYALQAMMMLARRYNQGELVKQDWQEKMNKSRQLVSM